MSRKKVIAAAALSIEKNSGLKPAVVDKSLSRDKAREQLRKINSRANVASVSQPADQSKTQSRVHMQSQAKPDPKPRQVELVVRCFDHDLKKVISSSPQNVLVKGQNEKLVTRVTGKMVPVNYQPFKLQLNSQVALPVSNGRSILDLELVRQIDSVDAGKVIAALKIMTPSVTNKGEYHGLDSWPSGVSTDERLDKLFTDRLLTKINLTRPYFNTDELEYGAKSDIAWSTDVSAIGLGFRLPPEAMADLTMSVWLAGLDRRKVLVAASSDFVSAMNCHVEMKSMSEAYGKYDIYASLLTVVYDFHVDVSFT